MAIDLVHPLDMNVADIDDFGEIERCVLFLSATGVESEYNCAGTLGTAGTWGGTFGSIGTWGCCC